MICGHCGRRQPIAGIGGSVDEWPFESLPTLPRKPVGQLTAYTYVCQRCAAASHSNETATVCPFCASPLVLAPEATGQIMPEAVMPFRIDHHGVRTALRKWARSRWFAPTSLKRVSDVATITGTYVPHWTFDAHTSSVYTGFRGVYRHVGSGKNKRTHVQWTPAQGSFDHSFDDVLVVGVRASTLPVNHLLKLHHGDAHWPLRSAVPYQPEYLAGYHALRYDIEPETAFNAAAQGVMSQDITEACKRQIGGGLQKISHLSTRYNTLTFKLVLLPVWVATYLHGGEHWPVLINGQTGHVEGDQPYSPLKLILAMLLTLAVIAAIVFLIVLVA